jgi:hypothetical protein
MAEEADSSNSRLAIEKLMARWVVAIHTIRYLDSREAEKCFEREDLGLLSTLP